jgi:hypothetical protein
MLARTNGFRHPVRVAGEARDGDDATDGTVASLRDRSEWFESWRRCAPGVVFHSVCALAGFALLVSTSWPGTHFTWWIGGEFLGICVGVAWLTRLVVSGRRTSRG